jgi:hypothetical protein
VSQHPDITVRVIILVDPVALRSARYPSPLDFPVTITVNGRWWCITITGTGAVNGIHNKSRTDDCRGNPQRVIGPVPPIAAIVSMAIVPVPAIVASAMAAAVVTAAMTAVVSPSITSIAAATMSVTSSINRRRH